jgi:branched-chain amino acid transport system substrate-binding protein
MYFEIYDPAAATPEDEAFVRKFRGRFGRNPDTWAAQGYDALHLLAKAARDSGSAYPVDLAYALRFMSLHVALGRRQRPLSF